jgi:hypothetical protein
MKPPADCYCLVGVRLVSAFAAGNLPGRIVAGPPNVWISGRAEGPSFGTKLEQNWEPQENQYLAPLVK